MSEKKDGKLNPSVNPIAASFQANSRPQMLKPAVGSPSTEPTTEKKEVKSVITGKVKQKKKSFFKKMGETFTQEDVDGVVSYVIWDVLVPAAKDTLSDMVDGVKDMILYGEAYKRGTPAKRNKDKSFVSYSSYYNREKERGGSSRPNTASSRSRRSFNDIVYETKGEAIEVLDQLVFMCREYDECSVADLNQLSGIPTNYTDNKWGWTDVSRATVNKIREGWIISLPKPEQLE